MTENKHWRHCITHNIDTYSVPDWHTHLKTDDHHVFETYNTKRQRVTLRVAKSANAYNFYFRRKEKECRQ